MQRPLLLAIDESSTLEDLRECATRAMSHGFDGVEWHIPLDSSPPLPANSQLDTMHIVALAIRCEMMDIRSAVRFVSSRLQAASSLGSSVLNLSIPPVRLGSNGVGFARYQDALNFAYDLLHQMRFEAEAGGVTIALEAATGGCLLSPIELRELIDAVNSSAVGVCLDVERIGSIGSPLDWIKTLHRRVQAVRYGDNPGIGGGAAAQSSQVPMDNLTQALDGIHSDCPLVLRNSAHSDPRPLSLGATVHRAQQGLPQCAATVRVSSPEMQSGTHEHRRVIQKEPHHVQDVEGPHDPKK